MAVLRDSVGDMVVGFLALRHGERLLQLKPHVCGCHLTCEKQICSIVGCSMP